MYHRGRREPFRGPPKGRREGVPEEFAIILDFLPQGNPFDKHPEHKRTPIAQVVGDKYFTLFELVVPEGEYFEIGEKIYVGPEYIGKGPIKAVSEPIDYNDLTTVAKENLPTMIARIIKEKEDLFVKIFNIAEPITLRMHMLELIPGIGKKTLKIILEERKRSPFTSFKDIEERLALRGVKLHEIERLLAERIISEMRGEERYYLFLKPKVKDPQIMFLRLLDRLYRDERRF